jgi:hypothetical protein
MRWSHRITLTSWRSSSARLVGAGGGQHREVFVEVAADRVERTGFVVDDQDAG